MPRQGRRRFRGRSRKALTLRQIKTTLSDFNKLCLRFNILGQYRGKKKFSCLWQFCVGRTVQNGHPCGFAGHHNYRPNVGLSPTMFLRKLRIKRQKWALIVKARKLDVLCGMADFVVADNICTNVAKAGLKCFTKRHVDEKDITWQLAMSTGVFEGAFLRCWESNKPGARFVDIDTKNQLWKFDGRLTREVVKTNFTGIRFSVIFFKVYDKAITAPTEIFWPPPVDL